MWLVLGGAVLNVLVCSLLSDVLLLLTAAVQIAKFIFLWDVNVMMNIKAKLEHLLLLVSLFCCAA